MHNIPQHNTSWLQEAKQYLIKFSQFLKKTNQESLTPRRSKQNKEKNESEKGKQQTNQP